MQKINGLEFKVCIEPTRKKRDAPVGASRFYIHISIINRSDQQQLNAYFPASLYVESDKSSP
jgi:hypothetical protein